MTFTYEKDEVGSLYIVLMQPVWPDGQNMF